RFSCRGPRHPVLPPSPPWPAGSSACPDSPPAGPRPPPSRRPCGGRNSLRNASSGYRSACCAAASSLHLLPFHALICRQSAVDGIGSRDLVSWLAHALTGCSHASIGRKKVPCP